MHRPISPGRDHGRSCVTNVMKRMRRLWRNPTPHDVAPSGDGRGTRRGGLGPDRGRPASRGVLTTSPRTDPDIEALLVSLGRTVVTEVVLRTVPNYHLRCRNVTPRCRCRPAVTSSSPAVVRRRTPCSPGWSGGSRICLPSGGGPDRVGHAVRHLVGGTWTRCGHARGLGPTAGAGVPTRGGGVRAARPAWRRPRPAAHSPDADGVASGDGLV